MCKNSEIKRVITSPTRISICGEQIRQKTPPYLSAERLCYSFALVDLYNLDCFGTDEFTVQMLVTDIATVL